MLKYPEKIKGKKTIIRKLEQKDLKESLKWLKDPQVNRFLSQDFSHFDQKQEDQWYEFIQDSNNDLAFAIETTEGRYIGNCALHKINWFKKTAEFGIVIGEKEFWNKGYGSDAVRIITDFATGPLGIKKIVLNVYEYNKRAIKVYQNCGFKLRRVLKKDHFYNQKKWDTYIMEYVKPVKAKSDVHLQKK